MEATPSHLKLDGESWALYAPPLLPYYPRGVLPIVLGQSVNNPWGFLNFSFAIMGPLGPCFSGWAEVIAQLSIPTRQDSIRTHRFETRISPRG
jgi:hypothetical protein